jgi:hypothetical protein
LQENRKSRDQSDLHFKRMSFLGCVETIKQNKTFRHYETNAIE